VRHRTYKESQWGYCGHVTQNGYAEANGFKPDSETDATNSRSFDALRAEPARKGSPR